MFYLARSSRNHCARTFWARKKDVDRDIGPYRKKWSILLGQKKFQKQRISMRPEAFRKPGFIQKMISGKDTAIWKMICTRNGTAVSCGCRQNMPWKHCAMKIVYLSVGKSFCWIGVATHWGWGRICLPVRGWRCGMCTTTVLRRNFSGRPWWLPIT